MKYKNTPFERNSAVILGILTPGTVSLSTMIASYIEYAQLMITADK